MAVASEDLGRTDPAAAGSAITGEAIRVRGLVQGVGFRPTVWRLAQDCGLSGEVRNDAEGVLIHVWGNADTRARFLLRLRQEAPPLARIDMVESTPMQTRAPVSGFRIEASAGGDVHTGVVPDAATCPACLEDMRDSGGRRYAYPFTNCTHCGPRLSIVRRIPYDRSNTSMSVFAMCPDCESEYGDPADRRFHAQPNACPACGPGVWLEDGADTVAVADGGDDPVAMARHLIERGKIVAIKGIGGIHLACDATNADTVDRLRNRKQRYGKPFALMAADLAMVRRYCRVNDIERELLCGPVAPVVLLEPDGGEQLAEGVAPGQRCLGFMLPYSPLHHLLMSGLRQPIVLTSGNRSEEPQCIDNQRALAQLGGIADVLLLHDRDIVNRLDDSVVRVIAGAPALLRRARGHAPSSLRLPAGFEEAPATLAFGGELKNTFCLLRDGEAILSQHLGDLENPAANTAYRETLDLYLALFEHRPEVLAVDSHPEYLAGKLGREWSGPNPRGPVEVQHHHAHIAACLADNGVDLETPPVLGIALDGLGYGADGTIWGGEFLLADYRDFRRVAAVAPVHMPGGAKAIHEPWRMAYSHLRQAADWTALVSKYGNLPFFRSMAKKPLATIDGMIDAGINSPWTSSCGRLFDAVAAVACGRLWISYEGQAAMELEAIVDPAALGDGHEYPFEIVTPRDIAWLGSRAMWHALLRDLLKGVPAAVVAARFHSGLARGIAEMIEHLSQRGRIAFGGRVALSGGVFQNAVLTRLLVERLESNGLEVLRHARVPANDGGLSLGQATIAAARALSATDAAMPGPEADKGRPGMTPREGKDA